MSNERDENTGRFKKSERPALPCSIAGCGRNEYARGLCNKHWQAARRNGTITSPVCVIAECKRPAAAQKMCWTHYLRKRRYGDPHFRKAAHSGENKTLRCLVVGCANPVVARGYCDKHNQRIRHHGDPNIVLRVCRFQTAEERRASKKAAQTKYRKSPAGRLRSRHNVNKKRIHAGGQIMSHIPKDVFLKLWSATECALCGQPMSDADKSLDHIIPVTRGGDHSLANLQMTHLRCNQKKSNKIFRDAAAA